MRECRKRDEKTLNDEKRNIPRDNNLKRWRLIENLDRESRHKRERESAIVKKQFCARGRDSSKPLTTETKHTQTRRLEMKFVAAFLLFALCASSVAYAVEHRKLQQNPFPLDLNAFATTVSGQITDNFGSLSGNVPSGSFFAPYLDGFQTILTGLATTVPQQIYDGPLAAASPLAG